jgi:hypothetical protein
MIGRRTPPEVEIDKTAPRGFDDFDLRLGDVMRGERATMGKSLLDVQRELRIKASFIAAIENADVSAFETPGFVAGYVRSYARYLNLDPDWAFETFCREANFSSASTREKLATPAIDKGPVYRKQLPASASGFDPFADPRVSFAPKAARPLSNLEPRAIGSMLVLLGLIGAVGYGAWSVLQEVQRVQVTPVDQTPTAVAVVDPIAEIRQPEDTGAVDIAATETPIPRAPLDAIYRPATLDAPVMVPRDGPIAALDPSTVGALAGMVVPGDPDPVAPIRTAGSDIRMPDQAPDPYAIAAAVAEAAGVAPTTPRVTADVPEVVLVAVRPAWVRVRAGDGSVILEKILNPGDTFVVPQSDDAPTLRTGAAGAVYFAVNGRTYGPAGPTGAVVDKIALNSGSLTQEYTLADATTGEDARKAVEVAEAMLQPLLPGNGDDPTTE